MTETRRITAIQKYPSVEAYYDDIARHSIESCTYCGNCIRNCLLLSHTSAKDNAPEDVIRKIMRFLDEGIASDEAYQKVFTCSSCGTCSDSCPEGIDTLPLFEAAKIKFAKLGKLPEAVNSINGIYTMWRVLAALQTNPSEARWLSEAPSQPRRTENVVFLGCTLPAFPQTVFAFLDILDRLGIDYVALAGGKLCCGFPIGPAAGLAAESEEKARELVANVKAFSPRRVILPCAGCYRLFTEIYPRLESLELNFEVQYYAEFLGKRLSKNDFTRPLEKQIVLQDSCMTRRTKVNKSVQELVEKIPGVKVMTGQEICCGGTPMLTFPQIAPDLSTVFVQTLVKETLDTGSDTLTNICQLCGMNFYPNSGEYSFDLKDVPTLINESMGGKVYENKWTKYWKCRSIDELVEATKENFEANGFTEKEVRGVLPLIFHFAKQD
jgi:Fe-S oxidoreductase